MNQISPDQLRIDQSIDFGSTAAAFSGGQGDFTIEFEPHATALEQKGEGYVVASLGEESGYVPYTAFSARKSYIEENSDTIQAFTAERNGLCEQPFAGGDCQDDIPTVPGDKNGCSDHHRPKIL